MEFLDLGEPGPQPGMEHRRGGLGRIRTIARTSRLTTRSLAHPDFLVEMDAIAVVRA